MSRCFNLTKSLHLLAAAAVVAVSTSSTCLAATTDFKTTGYKAISLEHPKQARDIFQSWIVQEPKNAEAYLGLCNAFLAMESPDQAFPAVNKAFQLNPHPSKADFFRTRACTYIQLRRFKDALPDINQAIKLEGLNGENLRLRASYYTDSRDFAKAFADCASAMKAEPRNVDNYQVKCDVELNALNFRNMLADAQLLVKLAPNAGRSYRTRGDAYLRAFAFKLAMADFQKALTINPEDFRAMILRGTCLFESKLPAAGLTELKRSIRTAPWFWATHASTANCLIRSIDASEALPYINKAIELNPYQPYSYFVRGELYRDTNEIDKALSDYSRLVDLGMPIALCTKGELLTNLGRYDEAIKVLSMAISNLPELVRPYRQRAAAYEKLSRMKEAESDYDNAVKYQPTSTGIHEHRGMFNFRMGKYQKAIDDFTYVIDRNSKTIRARQYRALCYEKLNKMDLAYKDKEELNTLEDVFHGFNKMSGQFAKAKKKLAK